MRFLVDQCVYSLTVKYLRELGHDIVTAEELNLQRADDSILLAKAIELNRVFLTQDLDLADIRNYPPACASGIIVLRVTPAISHLVHAVLIEFLSSGINPAGALVIIDRNKYRVRRS